MSRGNHMALKDRISLGMSLPHRSPDRIDMAAVRAVAERADALGFRDLWVTENTIDHAFSFDPMVVLTYAAALTSRIRLGVSVIVLPLRSPIHVAHAVASLDYVSGGRAILGVGLGREHYAEFG
jgi:alkanesulfonate monooxygenase SsuD/methylene tetrahydromethanopterin reductase-like flavin-dependent oxidoreductase (luciferase family)